MKKNNITLLLIIITSASMHMHASDKQPSSAWQRARNRLDAAHGRTAPEIPQTAPKALPTLQDIIAPADSERSFIATMRGYLSRFTGCLTWNESCESACPTWDINWNTDASTAPGFDQPITCKGSLGKCYQNLRGCSQESLDEQLKDALRDLYWSDSYPRARCKTIALICQGANPNLTKISNWTALHDAAWRNDYHFARFLLQHDADVNAKTLAECTPLTKLAHQCRYRTTSITDTAALLINAGAETHHSDYAGTALEIARSHQEYAPCRALADFLQEYEKQPSRLEE